MKSVQLAKVKDNTDFKLSERSKVVYTMQRKEKGQVIYTSKNSGRTFRHSSHGMTAYVN